uniref:sentrin-specific protease 7 isoform X2 n=1 Tax=Doryrhamphus excisus TaxID=161450 RepID=UPI0025AEB35F|nr:sentrin-specific protease 7 isoform X2 [Doryrhamphus excisus]
MMDHRKALTFSFRIDRDKLVSWAAIPGCKLKQSDLKLKRGSKLYDHNHAALVKWGMARGQPRLVLTDVLKTDLGKVYLSTQRGHACGRKAQTTSGMSTCKNQSDSCQGQRPTKNDGSKTPTATCDQKSTPTPLKRPRGRPRKKLLHFDNKEGNKDCGLSLSWNPARDAGDEFSPTPVKDIRTEERTKVQHFQRKRRGAWVNGTSTPKRHRESVLRLTGEDGRNGGLPQSHVCPNEDGEDSDNTEASIVQFTVGAVDGTPCLLPVIRPNLDNRSRGCRRLSSQDSTSQSSQGEPIVLSSDDEESTEVEEAGGRARSSSQEAVSKERDDSNLENLEVLPVVVDGPPPMPRIDTSFLGVAFCSMFCGGYQGRANGNLMIANKKIIIPLKDENHQSEVTVTLERKEMRRYSIWESEELAARGLSWGSNVGTVLLFCVTQNAAAAVQRELLHLCGKQDEELSTDKVSPFILLSLKDPVMGVEGLLLRSLLEIDCLNCLATVDTSVDALDLKDYINPSLSLDECLELIKRSSRDPDMLRQLGVDATESTSNTDRQSPRLDLDASSKLQLEIDTLTETAPDAEDTTPDEESVLELNASDLQSRKELEMPSMEEQEVDTRMQHGPEEEHTQHGALEEEHTQHGALAEEHTQHGAQQPNKEDNEEVTPLYTLCQRRTKGSYTVTMCKPDSSWVKYKHQGLGKRLVLFPPPPTKGGITVTMEDLQCLDSRQYLNDVIIDFYLKYLLHKSPQAIAERSHVFSSFFYKQLTRRDNASEGGAAESCQRQKRHQRVKTWTRHVDIFKKDFVFVPVNQEAHWYLVVICFPGLEEPTVEARTGSSHNGTSEPPEQEEAGGSQRSSTDATVTPSVLIRSDIVDTGQDSTNVIPSQVNCTEKTCHRKMVCKRPCILIMDSLKLSLHERIFKVLREYLQSEWEVRRGSSRDFGPDQMKSSHCQVPLQDNSSDCGLYLLQYVESFLKDPVVHFDLPLHLQHWFPRHQVRSKREEIRNLVLRLYSQQNLSKK